MIFKILHSNDEGRTFDEFYLTANSFYVHNIKPSADKECCQGRKDFPLMHTTDHEVKYELPDHNIAFEQGYLMNDNGKTIKIFD